MAKAQSVTSIGQSPEAERRSRMIKYTIAMSVRVICLILGMVVQGWLMWVMFAGAILLPYFAVIIANAQGAGKQQPKANAPVHETISIPASAFTVVDIPKQSNFDDKY
jgi:hypothetical protein